LNIRSAIVSVLAVLSVPFLATPSHSQGAAVRPELSVAYDVPICKWRALNAFDRGVEYDPVSRELKAHAGSETANILALNLADEVIRGRRTPADAAEFYDKALLLALSGKSSRYTTRLLFRPQKPA
jgi:hypothetical protein